MPTTWIEVADTAIKVGLGAAISSLASLSVAKRNHEAERVKELRKHKIELIEDIAVKTDQYFNAYLKLHNAVKGKVRGEKWKPGEPLSAKDKEQIRELDNDLLSAVELRRYCSSKLNLLGQGEAAKVLANTNDALSQFREELFFDSKVPTIESLDKYRTDISQLRREFENKISAVYNSL